MRRQFLFAAVATTVLSLNLTPAAAQNTSPFWSLAGNSNATGASKLGTTNSTPLRLFTNDLERMRVDPNGNIGIGVTSPIGRLTLLNGTTIPAGSWITTPSPMFVSFAETQGGNGDYFFAMASNTPTTRSNIIGRRARGTLAAPTAVVNNDFISSFQASGYDGSAFQNAANVDFFVDGAPSAGNVPIRISFSTGTNLGNRTERLKVGSTGNVTFNDNQMFLNASNDRVGIGTTAPERRLHVFNGSAGAFAVSNADASVVVEDNTNNYINMLAPNAVENGILFGNPGNAQDGGIIYLNSTDAMQFRTNGNTTRMTLSSAGNLDITGGTLSFGSVETLSDAGANTISSNSNIVPTSDNVRDLGSSSLRWDNVFATNFTTMSDQREKSNIRDLDYGMKEIMQLRATRFHWKKDEGKGEKLGLIAQELKKVLPEVVRDWEYKVNEENGTREKVASERMGVMYADIIPVLINGMQEQQRQIEALTQEVARLKGNVVTYTGAGSLGLATPNPAHGTARISYSLPSANSRAQLVLTDNAGKTVRVLALNTSGVVDINTASLSSGVYNYTLVVDGKNVETKKLTITRQ
jgi:polyhydroxyalkanoate synthesis regulator phasin